LGQDNDEELEYVEEACFYLYELGRPTEEIASEFNLSQGEVELAIKNFEKKIDQKKVVYDPEAKEFWKKIRQESGGDERITLVDEKGRYYHGWRSELEKMPTEQLVELLVVNKKYSDAHPLSAFSKTQPAVGYDPIVPLRNIRRAVSMIDGILQKRELQDPSAGVD